MITGKTLTDFTNLFSPNNHKKWRYNFKLFYDKCLKMAEHNFYETPNMYPKLNVIPQSDQQQFRLNKTLSNKFELLFCYRHVNC